MQVLHEQIHREVVLRSFSCIWLKQARQVSLRALTLTFIILLWCQWLNDLTPILHVLAVWARVGEALVTVGTAEWLLSTVEAFVFCQMMALLESLVADIAQKFSRVLISLLCLLSSAWWNWESTFYKVSNTSASYKLSWNISAFYKLSWNISAFY